MPELRIPVSRPVVRLLTGTIFRTTNRRRAERSRLMYGLDARGYYLRPLGVLNGLLGVVLYFDDEDELDDPTTTVRCTGMAELPLHRPRRLLHRLVWRRTGWLWAYSPSTHLQDVGRDIQRDLACILRGHDPHA